MNAEVDGEKLSELEFCSFFLLLLVAGNETTRTVTTNGMRALLEHPEQLRAAGERPVAACRARSRSSCASTPPCTTSAAPRPQDVEIRGRKIREGDKVVMWYPSANRDEDVFADPDRFDVTRAARTSTSPSASASTTAWARTSRGSSCTVIFEEILTRLHEPAPGRAAAPPALELHQRREGDADRVRPGARLASVRASAPGATRSAVAVARDSSCARSRRSRSAPGGRS